MTAQIDQIDFADQTLAEAAGLGAFVAWARGLPMAPQGLADLVQSIDVNRRLVGRMTTEVARRTVVQKEAPASRSAAISSPRFFVASVDPWIYDPSEFRRMSRFVDACDQCFGQGSVKCSTCRGAACVTCRGCNGSGKAYGIAANGSRRLMNCRACSKRGVVPCSACTAGVVTCGNCRGEGLIEHWLEIEETARTATVPCGQETLPGFN